MLDVLLYRLTASTIALFPEEGRQVARALPQGSLVKVEKFTTERFIEVMWEGKRLTMFTQDLRERGERVTGAA